uniref:Methyltransferase-like protein 17, mitochondrial n=1 Tax=Kalanchoe fedtschenkoi TaxID=63787 RepID=A0A7N0UG87_KALFE
MASLVPEVVQKIFTPETLRAAAKQSIRCHVVPLHLRRAIDKYLTEQDEPHMKRNVLRLSESFNEIKKVNLMLPESTAKDIIEDPLKSVTQAQRWKIKSAYGDIGFTYREDEAVAYVASRMPAVYSTLYRVLSEVGRRLSDFSPENVLDFGAGTGSALWAIQEVWPQSLKKINIIEPSTPMQRAGQNLTLDMKNLPQIQGHSSILEFMKKSKKSKRKNDLVIASYVLGEIPSLQDRITLARQLWELTEDVLVLVEPGTPQGSKIISQMRSHILWMEKRKFKKSEVSLNKASQDLVVHKSGAFIVAPCPHDGPCPLEKSGKYCHFVQRLQRTTSQRAYKRSKGQPLRGFEDEKFSYVVFRRGSRPRTPWPLDGMELKTLKQKHANRNMEDMEIDYEENEDEDPTGYESNATEPDIPGEDDSCENKDEKIDTADIGSGWGRIVFWPVHRGNLVEMNVCRAGNREGTAGSFDRVIVTRSKNPDLHFQAKRSFWGDLWPF